MVVAPAVASAIAAATGQRLVDLPLRPLGTVSARTASQEGAAPSKAVQDRSNRQAG
jgi:hypothetical protein